MKPFVKYLLVFVLIRIVIDSVLYPLRDAPPKYLYLLLDFVLFMCLFLWFYNRQQKNK